VNLGPALGVNEEGLPAVRGEVEGADWEESYLCAVTGSRKD
jgi:hypothetical protein